MNKYNEYNEYLSGIRTRYLINWPADLSDEVDFQVGGMWVSITNQINQQIENEITRVLYGGDHFSD